MGEVSLHVLPSWVYSLYRGIPHLCTDRYSYEKLTEAIIICATKWELYWIIGWSANSSNGFIYRWDLSINNNRAYSILRDRLMPYVYRLSTLD